MPNYNSHRKREPHETRQDFLTLVCRQYPGPANHSILAEKGRFNGFQIYDISKILEKQGLIRIGEMMLGSRTVNAYYATELGLTVNSEWRKYVLSVLKLGLTDVVVTEIE